MADHYEGLVAVVPPRSRRSAVVFVHGFSGDSDDTWGQFPLLVGATSIEHDLFTLGYASTLLPDIAGVWSADPDIEILATLLRTHASIDPLSRYESLILVAHSMGGLIVQAALVDDSALASRVELVVLFGTPSAGLKKASILRQWKRQFRNMGAGSTFITNLRVNWTERIGSTPRFRFLVVAGSKDQFVPPESSLGPFDISFRRVVDGNHLEIVKPKNAQHMSFQLLMSALTRSVQAPPMAADTLQLAAESPDGKITAAASTRAGEAKTEADVVNAALAFERAGKRKEAMELLERHRHLGTDVRGTLAGRIKRIWLENEERIEHAKQALETYESALAQALQDLSRATNDTEKYRAHGQVYYLAINVAFLQFVAFGNPSRAREMAALAKEHAALAGEDVWSLGTMAEVCLHFGDIDNAVAMYRRALERGDETWKYASMGQQAARIAATLQNRDLGNRLDELFSPSSRQVSSIFVTYSHMDKQYVERLQIVASPYLHDAEVDLDLWVDTRIGAGDKWQEEIDRAMSRAGVVVAFVSANFLASKFVMTHELPHIVAAAKGEKTRLLWVYVSPGGFDQTALKDFQAVHDVSKPLVTLQPYEQDQILMSVAQELKRTALSAVRRFTSQAT